MTSTLKEIIRDIKLYELDVKDKPDGYDILMSLRGLDSFKTEYPNVTHYGKSINDIKFTHYNLEQECILIKKELWFSIECSFNLLYIEAIKLTMWSIGSDPNLEGIPTQPVTTIEGVALEVTPILEGIPTHIAYSLKR